MENDESKWQLAEWKLYIFYTSDDRRLYVGITSVDFEVRWAQHEVHPRNKYWYAKVDHSKTKTYDIGYKFRWLAERAEKKEIRRDGGTLANIIHNHGRGTDYVDRLIAQSKGQYVPATYTLRPPPGQDILTLANALAPYLALVAVLVALVFTMVIAVALSS